IGAADREALAVAANGVSLSDIASGIVAALDLDRHTELARQTAGLGPEDEPSVEQLAAARRQLLKQAAAPLASHPELRQQIIETRQRFEQTIDTVSQDKVIETGFSTEARDR